MKMSEALKQHWPEYLMEAAALGLFMISACAFGVLLEHPESPVRQAIADPFLRRLLGGLAMAEILFKDESYRIIGACFEVYKEMGCGFLECSGPQFLDHRAR